MAEELNEQEAYEKYIAAGDDYAWKEEWDQAIGAYMKAVEIRREDPYAHNSLGMALLRGKRLADALRVYRRAHQLSPDDPVPLEKSADILERQGRLREAAEEYLAVADIYLAQHDLERAIGNWERATYITPGLVKVHQRLALAYERIGNKRQAVREYMTLAANFQRIGKNDIAIQAIERALRLEPRNPQALNALQALRSGAEIINELVDERLKAVEEGPAAVEAFDQEVQSTQREIADADPRGPIGEVIETALEQLAEHIFSANIMMEPSGMHAIQGIEFQRQEAHAEATHSYQQSEETGLRHPAIYMCLGFLMVEQKQWEEVPNYLNRVDEVAHLKAGAHHGLGIAHMEMGNARQAAVHLIKTMQMVDVGLAINSDEKGQLDEVYSRLLQSIESADQKTMNTLNRRFFEQLTGPDWKRQVAMIREQLDSAVSSSTKGTGSLLDIASVSPEIIESMRTMEEYVNARRYIMAMEEAYHVIEKEPDYLVVHIKVGEILVAMNRVHQAIDKYNQIAETYLARGNKNRAFEILNEVIKQAPMDIRLRQNLIELLEQEERYDEILEQYISMGDAHMELADFNNARMTFNQAIQLANRIDAEKSQIVSIYHRLADIEMSRLEMRGALRAFENIRRLDPTDEKARDRLIDLNFRLNNRNQAIKEMDALLQLYAKQRKGAAILALLEKWGDTRPDDEAIRARLGAVYQQLKRKDDALEQYYALFEIQLNSGRRDEACGTIRRILSMNPPDVDHYKDLFKQLGCG